MASDADIEAAYLCWTDEECFPGNIISKYYFLDAMSSSKSDVVTKFARSCVCSSVPFFFL